MGFSSLDSLILDLLHTGYAKLGKEWCFNNVVSPFSRLFYISTGKAVLSHTNQIFNLQSGYMYLIPSFTNNSYYCDNYHEQYYASFFDEIEQGASIYDIKRFKYKVKATAADIHCFKRLSEINPKKKITDSEPRAHVKKVLGKGGVFKSNFYMETQGILEILLSRFIEEDGVPKFKNPNEGDLSKVLIYIGKNLHKDLSVKTLALSYCLSEDHFSRRFLESFGIRPNRYVQQKRIQKAQFLLVTTNSSLKQIAKEVGLENISYFSRTFKKIVGNTPASFRKQHLKI